MKSCKEISSDGWSFTLMSQLRNLWSRLTRSSSTKIVLSSLLTLGIVVFILTQISITDLVFLLTHLAYQWIALGALLYLVNNIGRAVRLRILLPNQTTHFEKLCLSINAYTMFNYILPAWTGELSLLYFLKKYENISLDRGSAALVVGRIMDYLAISVIFIIGAWFSLKRLLDTDALLTAAVIKVALVMIAIAVIILVSMVWWGQRILKLTEWLTNHFGLSSSSSVKFVLGKLHLVITAFAAVHSFWRYALAFVWSLCLWLTIFIRFYAFLRGTGIETIFLNVIVGSTFAVLSKLIPFVTFGGIGTYEAGWTLGFMLVGFSKTMAIASGFTVNILTLLTSIVYGRGSLWALQWLKNNRAPRPELEYAIRQKEEAESGN